jgi:hypothetical protein
MYNLYGLEKFRNQAYLTVFNENERSQLTNF